METAPGISDPSRPTASAPAFSGATFALEATMAQEIAPRVSRCDEVDEEQAADCGPAGSAAEQRSRSRSASRPAYFGNWDERRPVVRVGPVEGSEG